MEAHDHLAIYKVPSKYVGHMHDPTHIGRNNNPKMQTDKSIVDNHDHIDLTD